MAVLAEAQMVIDIKEIWFTNMLLLKLDPFTLEDKHKISFKRDMFVLPNRKGMEVILHYLFSQLDSLLTYERFRDCWPVYDKKQEQLFRRQCVNWLASIAKDEPNSGLPRAGASLLLSPGGDKFYQLLLNFSFYCLRAVCLREAKPLEKKLLIPDSVLNIGSSVESSMRDLYELSLNINIVRHCHHVVSRLKYMENNLHDQWRQYAMELISDYRSTSKQRRDKMSQLNELRQQHNMMSLTTPISENQRELLKEKVCGLWDKVNSFLNVTTHEREVLESILKSSHTKYIIKGNDISFKIPDEVVHQMTSSSSQDIQEEDKINLVRLIEVCNYALEILSKHLRRGGLPELQNEIHFINNELHSHKGHVHSVQSLRHSLSKLKEKLSMKCTELEEMLSILKQQQEEDISERTREENPVIHISPVLLPVMDFSLLPPSPDPHKLTPLTPCTGTDSSIPYHQSIPLQYTVSTPEAVQSISQQIAGLSRLTVTTPTNNITDDTDKRQTRIPSYKTGLTRIKKKSRQTNCKNVRTPQNIVPHVTDNVTDNVTDHVTPYTQSPVLSPHVTQSNQSQHNVISPHEILAEQIAGVIVSDTTPNSSVQYHSVTDTVDALGQEAFISKDKILRTPQKLSFTTTPGIRTTPSIITTTPILNTSSQSSFDLFSSEIPPTPYRLVDLDLQSDSTPEGMGTRDQSESPLPLTFDNEEHNVSTGYLIDLNT